MSRNITRRQLQALVEQRVDEAWYNNGRDFRRGLGKAALITGLGAAAIAGGAYAADQGLKNQERYEEELNKEGEKMMIGSRPHYEWWCKEYGIDPKSRAAVEFYNQWLESQTDEARERKTRALVENIVRQELSRRRILR